VPLPRRLGSGSARAKREELREKSFEREELRVKREELRVEW
jgi:hypothetical protein